MDGSLVFTGNYMFHTDQPANPDRTIEFHVERGNSAQPVTLNVEGNLFGAPSDQILSIIRPPDGEWIGTWEINEIRHNTGDGEASHTIGAKTLSLVGDSVDVNGQFSRAVSSSIAPSDCAVPGDAGKQSVLSGARLFDLAAGPSTQICSACDLDRFHEIRVLGCGEIG